MNISRSSTKKNYKYYITDFSLDVKYNLRAIPFAACPFRSKPKLPKMKEQYFEEKFQIEGQTGMA
jgi:hypothetical protein